MQPMREIAPNWGWRGQMAGLGRSRRNSLLWKKLASPVPEPIKIVGT
jgi:hypothetical protein